MTNSTNPIVQNAIVSRSNVVANAVNYDNIKTLIDKWCSLVQKCAAMKRELTAISNELGDFTTLRRKSEVRKDPKLLALFEKTTKFRDDAQKVNSSSSEFNFYGWLD